MRDLYLGDIKPGECYELHDGTIAYVHSMTDRYIECYIRERASPGCWSCCLYERFKFKQAVRTMYMEG